MKAKNCQCRNRRPRKTEIKFDYGVPTEINGLQISEEGIFSLRFNGQTKSPIAAHLETTYERIGKHPKVIHHTPLDPDAPWVSPNKALTRYDLLLAIDTNTVCSNEKTVSVTVIVKCWFKDVGKDILAQWEPIHAIEFHNVVGQAENLGWKAVIQSAAKMPEFNSIASVGVIVDSDFSRIPDFNSRICPIYGEYLLPPKFELLYATADAGSEYIANLMLAKADRVAKSILKQVSEGTIGPEGLEPVCNAPYTHHRMFTIFQDQETDK